MSNLIEINENIPNKVVTIRQGDKSWYNGYLRRLRRKLNRTHAKAKRYNSVDYRAKFRHERNFYTNEIHRCKQEFDNKHLDSLNSKELSKKSFFKITKSIMKGEIENKIPSIYNNNNVINKDLEKAELFNTYFASASKLDDSTATLPFDEYPTVSVNVFDNITIYESEVVDQLKTLDLNKSYGPDGIAPLFLKIGTNSLSTPLTKLFNLSLSTGKFPLLWKRANVLPLFKRGDKHLVNNYRPVSLLSILGKILERIVFKNVYNYFRDNNLISDISIRFSSKFVYCNSVN